MLECVAESSLARYTHEPAPLAPRSTGATTYQGLGPNSTQKTSLIGEDCSRLICCAPPPSITDVGVNLTDNAVETFLDLTIHSFIRFGPLYLTYQLLNW
jgi:hypothetical protein